MQGILELFPPTAELLAFITAGLLLNAVPGQDMLYVIVQSSRAGLRRGILSALAVSCGTLFHIAAVSCGLAGLLAAVPLAFVIVKFAGAAYLVWLGLSMLLHSSREHPAAARPGHGDTSVFLQGMLTNILNPKVALFFLALLPQFCDPQRGSMSLQLALLGLLFNLNSCIVLLIVALLARTASRSIRRRQEHSPWPARCGGFVLMLLGLKLLLERQPG